MSLFVVVDYMIGAVTPTISQVVFGCFDLVIQTHLIQPLLDALLVVDGMAQALLLSACFAAAQALGV